MNTALWSGFDKRAYEYAHERRELERHYTGRAEDTPMNKSKAALIGAGLGVVGGGILGAVSGYRNGGLFRGVNSYVGGLLGGLLGGAIGAGGGALAAISDKLGIENAKRIMAMPKKERSDYLHALARDGEISEREANEWSRASMTTAAMHAAANRPHHTTIVMPASAASVRVPVGNCQNCGSAGAHKTSMGWACDHCGSNR